MLLSLRSAMVLIALLFLLVATAFTQNQLVNGGKEASFQVPPVIGQSTKEASAAVRAAGLDPKFRLGRAAPSKADSLKVYSVVPKPGTRLPQGAEVSITIYAETTATETDSNAVPNLIGLTAEQAKDDATAHGLTPKFQIGAAAPTPAQALTVYAQAPRTGAPLVDGTEITITIYAQSGSSSVLPMTGPELTSVLVSPSINHSAQELIDPRSGLLLLSVTDLVLEAGPVDLDVRRFLQNHPYGRGLLGSRWRLNWEKQILLGGNMVAIAEEVGLTIFEPEPSGEVFRSIAGDLLVREDEGFVRTTPDGIRESFDAGGRLIERDERNGNRIVLTYDADGRLSRVAGPYNSSLLFTTDEHGQLIRIDSSTGASVQYVSGADPMPDEDMAINYAYDDLGMLTRIDHPQTGATEYTYDESKRVLSRRWGDGSRELYEYDDERNLQRHIDALGRVTATQWSQDRLKSETIDPPGNKTVIKYDTKGRPVEITGATSQVSHIRYDKLGRIESVENSAQGTVRLQYQGEGGQPAAIIGPDGEQTSFEFDTQQNLQAIYGNDKLQRDLRLTYYPNGLIQTIRTNAGEQSTLQYDAQGRVVSATDATGQSYRFDYDRLGNLIRETDPLGNTTMRTYDFHGRLISLTGPEGGTTRYEYTPSGLLSRQIDPMGGVTQFEYDKRGRLVQNTDPVGRATRFEYHADGQLRSVTDPTGNISRIEYDAGGNVASVFNPLGGASSASYDALGRIVESTDTSSGMTRYEYSNAGDLVEWTDPSGAAIKYRYDEKHRVSEIVGSRGRGYRIEYTLRGDIARIIPSAGPSISLKYDRAGNLTRMTKGVDPVVDYEYDELGRCTKARYSTGKIVTFTYDALGNLLAWKDNLGAGEAIKYDRSGRIIEQSDSTGDTTTMRYDLAGNLISVADPLGNVTRRSYDLSGELSEVILPAGDRTKFEYDRAGRLSRVHHPGGGESSYSYDAAGNPIEATDPLKNVSHVTYDAAGRAIRNTDAKGQTTTYAYNTAGQLIQKRLADGKVIAYRYDQQGNIVEVDDGNFPVQYEYDDNGNKIRIEYPTIKRVLRYEYDNEDRLVRFTDSEGQSFNYVYNADSQLSAIELPGDQNIAFSSDAAGRQTSVTYPSGVTGTSEYDGKDRVTRLAYTDADGEEVAGWTYSYDAAGNCRKTVDSSEKTIEYDYDANGQLIEENAGEGQKTTYGYLPGGDRGKRQTAGDSIEYVYDEASRLLKAGGEEFSYDENGNLIRRKGVDGVTQYAYGAEDQLVKVILPDKSEVSYGYAPTGERIWRRDANGLTHYVTDGLNVLAELDETLKPKATYLHQAGMIDRPLLMTRNGKTYCLHRDQLGSIRSLTDEKGKQVASYDYDAFGRMISSEGTVENPFTYTARELDKATGLYYYRARWYDARLGRFLTKDPVSGDITSPISLNPYLYAQNNPVKFIDPLGTESYIESVIKTARGMSPAAGMRYLRNTMMTATQALVAANEPHVSPIAQQVVSDPARVQGFRNAIRAFSRELGRMAQANPQAVSAALQPAPPPSILATATGSTTPPAASSVGSVIDRTGPTLAVKPPAAPSTLPSGATAPVEPLPSGYRPGGGGAFASFSSEANPTVGQRVGQFLKAGGRKFLKVLPVAMVGWATYNVVTAPAQYKGQVAGSAIGSFAPAIGPALAPLFPAIARGIPGGVPGVLLSIGVSVGGAWIGSKIGGAIQRAFSRPGTPPSQTGGAIASIPSGSHPPPPGGAAAGTTSDPEVELAKALKAEHQAALAVSEHLLAMQRAEQMLNQLNAAERERARQALINEQQRRVAAYNAARQRAATVSQYIQNIIRASGGHGGGGQSPHHGGFHHH